MTSDIKWPNPEELPWPHAPRNEERVMVFVDVEPQSTTVAGQHTPHGQHFRLAYKSDLPAIKALVQTKEDRDRLALAQEMWQREFEQHLKSCGGNEAEARATIGPSVESYYAALPGGRRGRPPLKSLTVCPTPVPAPTTPMAVMEQQSKAIADGIAAGIAAALEKMGVAQPQMQNRK